MDIFKTSTEVHTIVYFRVGQNKPKKYKAEFPCRLTIREVSELLCEKYGEYVLLEDIRTETTLIKTDKYAIMLSTIITERKETENV